MAGRDMIVLRMREVKRLKAVQSTIERQITQKRTGTMIGLSDHQVRRWLMEAGAPNPENNPSERDICLLTK